MYELYFILFFFFNDTATTEIYTLSLHDALPICPERRSYCCSTVGRVKFCVSLYWLNQRCFLDAGRIQGRRVCRDRKSTRLNSSHLVISYAVFCLKKKKKKSETRMRS